MKVSLSILFLTLVSGSTMATPFEPKPKTAISLGQKMESAQEAHGTGHGVVRDTNSTGSSR